MSTRSAERWTNLWIFYIWAKVEKNETLRCLSIESGLVYQFFFFIWSVVKIKIWKAIRKSDPLKFQPSTHQKKSAYKMYGKFSLLKWITPRLNAGYLLTFGTNNCHERSFEQFFFLNCKRPASSVNRVTIWNDSFLRYLVYFVLLSFFSLSEVNFWAGISISVFCRRVSEKCCFFCVTEMKSNDSKKKNHGRKRDWQWKSWNQT